MASKKIVTLAFPTSLLDEIDQQAEAKYTSRSDYIRQTMVQALGRAEEAENAKLWALSDGLAADAKAAGYETDADFNRLAKEIRQKRLERYSSYRT